MNGNHTAPSGVVAEFLKASCVPPNESHGSGNLERAQQLLREQSDLAGACLQTAAVLGEAALVRDFLARDPASATARGGPYNWDPLTYLCFSKFLRLDRTRSAGLVEAATALLDAGASAQTGFFSQEHQPHPEFECVLYGAAGVAHHPELTRLLLERGADPNDGEVTYHAPEGDSNDVMHLLVATGRLSPDSLATMLLRKADWHDYEGLELLLRAGADPNRMTHWGLTALHQGVRRDNDLANINLLLDHGADPNLPTRPNPSASSAPQSQPPPQTAAIIAAHRGRRDVLQSLQGRGLRPALAGVDRLIAACAMHDADTARSLAQREPGLVDELRAMGPRLLGQFAGVGNTEGSGLLIDLGVDPRAKWAEGDGYFGIAPQSTALHVAAWRIRPATVQLLLERGATVDERDGRGQTPLRLAVRACVETFWTERRTPECVRLLLDAGANPREIPGPSGYAEVDALISYDAS
jgi:ankyrin repeat protein